MAGHSQFKNIMYRKGAQDAKRAKAFTKLIRELTTAARCGLPDPASNSRLRSAIIAARNANMPKDTIERAIKRGAGAEGGDQYEEVRYEGYGPGGVALAVRGAFSPGDRISFEQPGQRPVGAIVVAYAEDDGILQLQFAAEQAIGGAQSFAVAA